MRCDSLVGEWSATMSPSVAAGSGSNEYLERVTFMRDWVLAEQNYAHIKAHKWEVAVLPFGATEPHNLHMPYATDNYEVEAVGQRACEHAYRAGAKVILLPTIPY